jgi:putative endopeptidase
MNIYKIVLFAIILSISNLKADMNVSSIKPKIKDDFYTNVNFNWLRDTKIPDSKPGISSFQSIKNNIINKNIKILLTNKNPKTQSEIKIKNLYSSFKDMNKRNKLGITPIMHYLNAISKVKNYKDLIILNSQFSIDGIHSILDISSGPGLKDSSKYILHIVQSELYLAREHYLNNDKRSIEQRNIYKKYLTELFKLAKFKKINTRIKNILNIETKLAKIQFSPVENRNTKKIYNSYNYQELSKLLNNFPLDKIFSTLRLQTKGNINIHQVRYLAGINNLLTQINLTHWKDYLRANILTHFARVLSYDFKKANIAVKKQLGMMKEEPNILEQGIDFIDDQIPMIAGRAYVENFVNKDLKKNVNELVISIKDEFRLAILNSTNFTKKTKNKALHKLDKMLYNIAYPDKWRDFSKLKITNNDLVGNLIRTDKFNYLYDISKVGKKVDKEKWSSSPYEVNAYYNPQSNKFVLLAGILHKPFFSVDASYAENYGGIGSVIAHEIGHAFDDQGSQFDADGNFNNWWSDQDRKTFNKIKNKLISRANKYEVFPNKYLNGNLTIGEIIGDLNGLSISHKAYARLIKNKKLNPSSIDKFFKQYAYIWRTKKRYKFALKLLELDPHPDAKYRTNETLKHIDAFYETYDIKPEDGMYKSPSQRIHFW